MIIKPLNLNVSKIIFLTFFCFLLSNSCKKETRNNSTKNKGLSISEAQNFYNKSIRKSKQIMSIAGEAGVPVEIIDTNTPIWDLADSSTDSLWYVVETVVDESIQKGAITNRVRGNDLTQLNTIPNGKCRLIVVKSKISGEMESALMYLTAYTDEALNNLSKNTYKYKDPSFTGSVMFTTTDNKFINGWEFINGKPSKKMMIKKAYIDSSMVNVDIPTNKISAIQEKKGYAVLRQNTFSTTRPLPITNDGYDPNGGGGVACGTITDHYTMSCYTVNGQSICTPWEFSYTTYEPGDCNDATTSGGQPPLTSYTQYTGQYGDPGLLSLPGGGSGGSTGREIKNEVIDKCLKDALDRILSDNVDLKGEIAMILGKFEKKNTGITITIVDDNNLKYADGKSKPAQTIPIVKKPFGFEATITVNPGYYKDTSIESLAAGIIHEFVHAYISYQNNPSVYQTHQCLAENYVNPMAEFLKAKFNLTSLQSYALAWSGIADANLMIDNNQNAVFTMGDGTAFTRFDLDGAVAPFNYQGEGSLGHPITCGN